MGDVVRLVKSTTSKETVDMLEAAADEQDVIGALIVLFYPGRRHVVDAAGIAREDPTYARGTLLKLDDELAKLLGSDLPLPHS